MAGPGGGHGDEEEVVRFWKGREDSAGGIGNGPHTGIRESRAEDAASPGLASTLALAPEPPPSLGPTSAVTVA